MKFILTTGEGAGIAELTERLSHELREGKKVLWLVCGGSNIAAEVAIMKNVPASLSENLTVTLTDERYGEIGHKDSNWQQLKEAGFDIKSGKAFPVLNGKNLQQTTTDYDALAKELLADNDIVIAQFGIGGDGHIAGILPGSPAAAEDKALAAGYEAGQFTRLTLTFPALGHIDAAYAFTFGAAKKDALTTLYNEDAELSRQPAQVLKQLPEAYLYSDQIGEHS